MSRIARVFDGQKSIIEIVVPPKAAVRVALLTALIVAFGLSSSSLRAQPVELVKTLVSTNTEVAGRFGVSTAGVGDMNGDGASDVLVGASTETVGGLTQAGRAYLFSGADGTLLETFESPNPTVEGTFGVSVTGVEDVNGDEINDLLVGAPGDPVGNNDQAGQAYLFSGADGTLLHRLTSPNAVDFGGFGGAIAGVRDIDGDGAGDLLIGATGESTGGTAYLFSGKKGNLLRTLVSPNPRIGFGVSVAGIGDADGDQTPDLLVGASGENVGTHRGAGRAYVFSGADGSLLQTLTSPNPVDIGKFGAAVAGIGDIDGNGREDIVVGAIGEIVGGNPAGRVHLFSDTNGNHIRTLVSPNPLARGDFGEALAGVGDVNGDETRDLLVGAPSEGTGRAYLFSGADGSLLQTLESPNLGGGYGRAIAGIEKTGGTPGLLVGALGEAPGGASAAGRAYLYTSSSTGAPQLRPTSGAPGTVSRIYGSGFGEAPSDNTVAFGGAQATLLKAKNTVLRAEVPPGPSGPVAVTVSTPDSTVAVSERFTVLTGGRPSFSPVGAGLTGANKSSADWGDFDDDGDLDLVVAGDTSDPSATIYRNDGDGTFVLIGAGLLGVSDGTSVDWGDYNSDGDLDLVVTGEGESGPTATIYRNEGNGTFTPLGAGLTGVNAGSAEWGDFNGDGDLDLVVTGEDDGLDPTATLYENRGNGTFTPIGAGITGVESGTSASWGDFDGDGDLDLVVVGNSPDGDIAQIYRNDGGGTFRAINAGLAGVTNSSAEWGDYDGDGDLDLVITGLLFQNGNFVPTTTIYRNDGGGSFTSIGAGLTGVSQGSADWGDFDGDGTLDLVVTGDENGFEEGGRTARIYRNEGNGTFSTVDASLTGVVQSSSDWGDFDGDGDLDLLITGERKNFVRTATLYRNAVADSTAPDPPSALSARAPDSTTVELDWTASDSADVEQYAVYRSTAPIDSSGGPSSKRPLARTSAQTTSFTDRGVTPKQTYYYRATALDSASNESSFSGQDQVAPGDTTAPDPPGPLHAEAAGEAAPPDSARVRWAKSDSSDVAKYRSYRDTTTIDSSAGPSALSALTTTARNDTSHLDTSVQANQAYHYRATAVDSAGNESGFSKEAILALGDTSAPDPPAAVQAEVLAPDSVGLRWQASDSSDVEAYRIYRDTAPIDSSGPGPKRLAAGVARPSMAKTSGRTPVAKVPAESTSYVDSGLTPGQRYHYRATAVDSASNESAFSNEAKARPGAIQLGPIVVKADQITETSPGVFQLTGNVRAGGVLAFDGEVTVDTGALSIAGSGAIEVIPSPVDTIYEGEYTLSLVSETEAFLNGKVLKAANSTLQAGGLDVRLDGIEILTGGDLTEGDLGIRVEGKLQFPEILGKIEAQVSTLQITKKKGLDIAGTIEVESVELKRGLATLEQMALTFDSAKEKFTGSATLATRPLNLGVSATVLEGMLEAVRLDVDLKRPVPIASTGVGLAGATGAISGLATSPTRLKVGADLVPIGGGRRVVQLEGLNLTYRFDTKITGSGTLQLFERDQANARLTVTSRRAEFDGQVGLSVPKAKQDVLSGQLGAGVHKGPPIRMNGRLQAELVVPDFDVGFPFDWIASAVGLPYAVGQTRNVLGARPTEGTGQVKGEASVLESVFGGIQFAYGVAYDGALSADFATNMSNLNLKLFARSALEAKKTLGPGTRFEGKSLMVGGGQSNPRLKRAVDTLQQEFTLPQHRPALVIRVEGESALPSYTVTTPSGRTIGAAEAAGRSDVLARELAEQNKTFFTLTDPAPGQWTVNLPEEEGPYALDVIGADPAPALEMGPPQKTGSSVELSWEASDPVGEATVDLFYDTDRKGQNGILIEEGLPESQTAFTWDASAVPTGRYFVYAVAEDDKNAPVVDYAPEPVDLAAAGAPAAPEGLTLTPTDTALVASWNEAKGAEGYTVYYREETASKDASTKAPVSPPARATAQAAGIGDTAAVALEGISSGRTYRVGVSAVGPEGRESPLSAGATAQWTSPTRNNAPLITTGDPQELAREEIPYRQQISATDGDGDALSWSLDSGPEGMSVNSDGTLSWSPEAGTYLVEVKATDPSGASDSLRYTLRAVGPRGAAARLAFSRSVYRGEKATGQLILEDPDLNRSSEAIESTRIEVQTGQAPGGRELLLAETSAGSGRFTGTFSFDRSTSKRLTLPVAETDSLRAQYDDSFPDTTVAARAEFVRANAPPVASADQYTTTIGQAIDVSSADGVLANDSDPNGDALTASVLSRPTGGSLTLNSDGSFSYAPDRDFDGEDAFEYEAADGSGGTDRATVTIAVHSAHAPLAEDDSYVTTEDEQLVVASPANGVLANDSDADGDSLRASAIAGPSQGTLTFDAEGTFQYRPNANFHGGDAFLYRASDGTGRADTAQVTLSVLSVNDPPSISSIADQQIPEDSTAGPIAIRVDDAESAPENLSLSTSSSRPSLLPADSIDVTGPDRRGDICLSAAPLPDSNGTATVTLRASDGDAKASEDFALEVTPVNDAPEVVAPVPDDSLKAPGPDLQLTGLQGTVFRDPEGKDLTFTASSSAPAVLEAKGESRSITLSPKAPGTAAVTLAASDGKKDASADPFTVAVAQRPEGEQVPAERARAVFTSSNTDDTVPFGDTGLELALGTVRRGGVLSVRFFEEPNKSTSRASSGPRRKTDPSPSAETDAETVSPYRWSIKADSASVDSVAARFRLSDEDITGIENPKALLVLLDSTGSGHFNSLEATYNPPAAPSDSTGGMLAAQEVAHLGTFRLASSSEANPLPVELTAFTAVAQGKSALLRWSTSSETNNAGFEVQHRAPEEPAFSSVGFVEGAGTTTRSHSYSYEVPDLDPGTHRFRLRQVNTDGTSTRTASVAVDIEASRALALTLEGPNPFRQKTQLAFTVGKSGPARLLLYDVLGQEVKELYRAEARVGRRYDLPLPAHDLPAGTYFARLFAPSGTRTEKVVVIR